MIRISFKSLLLGTKATLATVVDEVLTLASLIGVPPDYART